MKAIRLRTEYLQEPMGIDITEPRLMWNDAGGTYQTAYQIICRDDGENLLWDSGKVASSSMYADYAGEKLKSRASVLWQVRLWDEQDQASDWSDQSSFELGLLHPADWQAKWITGDYQANKKHRCPVDCFRKVFTCGEAKKARLYITACGLYEAELNGQRIGNFVLAPGITDYNKRIQYQTYDISELLVSGKNVLTVQLADGWYRGSTGAWGLLNQYGTETALLCQLEITGVDGRHDYILSDENWAWSNDGPIRFADNKDGETVDANQQPSYSGKAKITSRPVIPTASNNVPLTEHEHFTPKLIRTPSGKTTLDFGQNIAGYISFRLMAHKGQRIYLQFGEMLDNQGELTLKNIQCASKKKTTPLQQIEYICKDGLNEYNMRFAIFGFQYALVETDVPFEPKDFEAVAVYSDMEDTLSFDSSNELLNRFVSCTRWSTKNNSGDLPTDCPTRERHGWTGDAQIFFSTAAYLFDYAAFSKKFLHDMYDWQRKDGCLPQIAPAGGVDFYMNTMNGSVGWADAGVIIPYRFWKHYGDRRILTEFYPGMKRYARFMMKRCGRLGLMAKPLGLKGEARQYAVNAGQSYGEWAEPSDVHPNKWTDMVAPHPEVSTAYTAYVMGLLAEIADELGEKTDSTEYKRYHEGCKKAYQAMVEKPAFSLDTDRQSILVRPLYMELLNERQTTFAKKRLLQAVKNYRYRVGTGFLSTPLIMDVLDDIDLDAAYKMLENEEMPGWLFMPKMGATTVWESWEGTQAQGGIASLNHYSKGAVLEWVFRVMCGIRVNGENHFTIAPRPGGSFTHAETSYNSVFGKVESGWKQEGDKITYTVTIPANTTAEIILPGASAQTVTAGTHIYTV